MTIVVFFFELILLTDSFNNLIKNGELMVALEIKRVKKENVEND